MRFSVWLIDQSDCFIFSCYSIILALYDFFFFSWARRFFLTSSSSFRPRAWLFYIRATYLLVTWGCCSFACIFISPGAHVIQNDTHIYRGNWNADRVRREIVHGDGHQCRRERWMVAGYPCVYARPFDQDRVAREDVHRTGELKCLFTNLLLSWAQI